jgi:dienelactone hydrolase
MIRPWNALILVLCSAGAVAQIPATLPGTEPLTWQGDLAVRMMDGAHRFIERKIDESPRTRQKFWHRDLSSRGHYEASVEPNRSRLRKIIGVVDPRVPAVMERFADNDDPALVAETSRYRISQVRWPVLEGVSGEGLLLEPRNTATGRVVAIPDAGQTPEQLAGLAAGIEPRSQWARRLAENGFEVLVPMLIDRTSRWSGHPEIRLTDQTHREWIYRQAFQMGRHIVGYEVQKVLAAVDWFRNQYGPGTKIGVAGYGEGGLIGFYSAAVDTRIDSALVSGYFDSRQQVWSEPIYRNVWGLLREFGDAEIATLIAPRALVVEYSNVPHAKNQKGDLATPPFDRVANEFKRIDSLTRPGFQPMRLIGESEAAAGPGSEPALEAFASSLGASMRVALSTELPADARHSFDAAARQKRQVLELEHHVQQLVRAAAHTREQFYLYKVTPAFADETWSRKLRHPTLPPEPFIQGSRPYRQYFREEVLGSFDDPLLPLNPRTRRIYDTARFTGYEVVLDVFPDVFAWGILLIPKNIKAGERRPVVVCQHGRGSVPRDVVEGDDEYYYNFAAKLAEEGFITFAPHNLYRGEDRYRWLSRKANGVKGSLFSFIVSQHDAILRWLGSLPMVDPRRMAFYGLSYGGETAVRVPAVLQDYALSICSGDFNSWTRKVAGTDERFSFMYTIEWEMPYFDMGNTFDYAEMTYLIFPRPFMVERGQNDRVGRDEWVSYEYAKTRWLYTQLGLGHRTEIEYFNGGHTINGEGTFHFLHKHLNWPEVR